MQKNLDENSYEKRIENIEKGKSYLKSNGFFRSKSNLFEDIQKLKSFRISFHPNQRTHKKVSFLNF